MEGTMMHKNEKTIFRSAKGFGSVLVLLVALPVLVACANPIAEAAEAIRTDAASSRIAVTQFDATTLSSGGTLDCGQAVYGSFVEISLTVKNEGKSALVLDMNSISLTMGMGTESGSFAVSTSPSPSIATGSSSIMVLRFAPSTEGAKKATLSIATNDTNNSIFRIVLEGTGSSILMSAKVDSATTSTASISANVELASGLSFTESGICWGSVADPTIEGGLKLSRMAVGSFQELITGLSAGTMYYVRPYITREGLTLYGPQISFITLPDAPDAPTVSVLANPSGSGKLALAWNAVTGASIYDIFYNATDSFPSGQTPLSTTGTTYTVPGLTDFATCYFWLKARNVSGSSSASSSAPGAPGVRVTGISLDRTGLTTAMGSAEQLNATVAPVDATYPTVSWSSSDEAVAKVSSSGLVSAIGAGTATITATSSATADGGVSKTATCAVSVLPTAPVAISTLTANGGEVTLNWSPVAGATSYNVYYSLTPGAGTGGSKVSGIADSSYTVSGLTNWSRYYFVITAVGTGGESLISNQLDCMPIRQEIIVVNKASNSIDFNLFNAASGSVTRPSGHEYIPGPNGLAVSTDGAASVAIDPSARNALYVAYTGTAANLGFATYTYSKSEGYATSPYTDHHCDGIGPEHLMVVTTPSGKKCLYVAYNAQAYVIKYDIDVNGNLSGMRTFVNARNDSARYLSADPSGKFLFASNFDASRITSYSIDTTTGDLTEVGYVSSGGSKPYRSVVTPDGSYLLVTNYGSGNVASFAINSVTGALSQAGSISTTGEGPTGIAIDTAGANVYVCSARNRTYPTLQYGYLNRFKFSGGSFTGVSDWAQTLFGPTDIVLDITGTKAIVLNLATVSNGSTPQARVYPVNATTGVVSGYDYSTSFDTGGTPCHILVVKLP